MLTSRVHRALWLQDLATLLLLTPFAQHSGMLSGFATWVLAPTCVIRSELVPPRCSQVWLCARVICSPGSSSAWFAFSLPKPALCMGYEAHPAEKGSWASSLLA